MSESETLVEEWAHTMLGPRWLEVRAEVLKLQAAELTSLRARVERLTEALIAAETKNMPEPSRWVRQDMHDIAVKRAEAAEADAARLAEALRSLRRHYHGVMGLASAIERYANLEGDYYRKLITEPSAIAHAALREHDEGQAPK